MSDYKNGFLYCGDIPYAYVQWKGTDVCMDFNCDCGTECHFDGFFAYTVKCPNCRTVWEMPTYLFPRKADKRTLEYWRENPLTMGPEE